MQQANLVIKHACIVTMDPQRRILNDSAIAVVGDSIAAIGTSAEIESQWCGETVIDATDKVVFPGLINTHNHLFQVLVKGLGRDKLLFDWLNSSVRKAICRITPERAKAAATVGCIENLHAGCTTVMDYQYCHGHHGIDEAVCTAFEETGIRGVLARGYTELDDFDPAFMPPVQETEDDFLRAVEALDDAYKNHPRIDVAIAPVLIWSITPDAFRRCREIANRRHLLITLHINETVDDNEVCQQRYGKDAVPLLEEWGILGPDFVGVHCVNMTPEEIALFGKYGCKVSHNPVSNMILASGAAPIPEFQKAGVAIGLATDGSGSNDSQDMIEVLKSTALLHKCVRRDASIVTAEEVLEMATLGGAKCLGREQDLGSLEVGKKADLFIYNPRTPKAVPMADPISTLVYSSSEENVETTIVGGNIVMENRTICGLDEDAALAACQRAAAEIREESGLGNTHWGQQVKIGPFQK